MEIFSPSILIKSNLNIFIKPIDKSKICGIIYLGDNSQELLYHIKVKRINYKIIGRSDYQMNLNNEILRYAISQGDGIIGLTCKDKIIKSKNNIKEQSL